MQHFLEQITIWFLSVFFNSVRVISSFEKLSLISGFIVKNEYISNVKWQLNHKRLNSFTHHRLEEQALSEQTLPQACI